MPHAPNRRQFLTSGVAAGLSLPFAARAAGAFATSRPAPEKRRLLIIGGTGHLGPAIVHAAKERGHELTLFNRGRTDPGLFPDLETIQGDRRKPEDVAKLKGRDFDAVIDDVAYVPQDVRLLAETVRETIPHYVLISSVSVYPEFGSDPSPVDESTPVDTMADEDPKFRLEDYGRLKASCEAAAEKAMPGKCTQVRPGYIVGPRDRSDRFTYWPLRIARGGEVLAPGDPGAEFQVIDVRDLGAWLVHVVEQRLTGTFNAVGYRHGYTIEEMLHGAKCVLNDDVRFTWVDDDFLEQHRVTSWGELPWIPKKALGHIANDKAIAAGMTFRPIADTIRDTHAWALTRPADYEARAGMKPDREQQLLAAWHARGK